MYLFSAVGSNDGNFLSGELRECPVTFCRSDMTTVRLEVVSFTALLGVCEFDISASVFVFHITVYTPTGIVIIFNPCLANCITFAVRLALEGCCSAGTVGYIEWDTPVSEAFPGYLWRLTSRNVMYVVGESVTRGVGQIPKVWNFQVLLATDAWPLRTFGGGTTAYWVK